MHNQKKTQPRKYLMTVHIHREQCMFVLFEFGEVGCWSHSVGPPLHCHGQTAIEMEHRLPHCHAWKSSSGCRQVNCFIAHLVLGRNYFSTDNEVYLERLFCGPLMANKPREIIEVRGFRADAMWESGIKVHRLNAYCWHYFIKSGTAQSHNYAPPEFNWDTFYMFNLNNFAFWL